MDVVLIFLLVLFAVRGLLRGLSGELAHLLSAVAAVALFAYVFAPAVTYLEQAFGFSRAMARLGTAVFFLLAVFGFFYLLKHTLGLFTKNGVPAVANRLLGLVTGALRGGFILLVGLLLLRLVPIAEIQAVTFDESRIGRWTERRVFPLIGGYFKGRLEERPADLRQREPAVWE
jgi:membrane protein required for colicin V production